MTGPSVVKHTHTTHPADAECAASATAETHQPSEFVTITIGFVTITIGHGEAEWRAMHRFMADQGNFVQRQIQAACRAALGIDDHAAYQKGRGVERCDLSEGEGCDD